MVAGNLAERPRQWADSAGTGWIVGPPTAPAKKEKKSGKSHGPRPLPERTVGGLGHVREGWLLIGKGYRIPRDDRFPP